MPVKSKIPNHLLKLPIEKRAKRALDQTLNCILPDLLECSGQDSIPQAEVIEVVLDANYLETNGQDSEAAAWIRAKSYEEQEKFAKTVFTCKRYCM
jgi:hypothetical protein